MLDAESRNLDFPSLIGRVYLNTAAEGIPPRAVLDALAQYGRDKLLGMDGRALHEAQWNAVRESAAKAFGLTAGEIGICSCSSEAFNLAAHALSLSYGDEVVVNDLDFPAGVTPWLSPASRASVKIWRARDGALRTEDLIPLLGPRTRLLTASLISFYNGFHLPLAEVVATLRRHSSALFALDVTQALGRIPLDIAGVDWVVSSTHKWLLGSHGCGLVGVPQARAEEWTVPAGGWFHLKDAFGADRFERIRPKPGAASFSIGMPNYPAVYAVRAALDYIQNVGIAAIDDCSRPLVEQCFTELRDMKVELLTPRNDPPRGGILAFRHPHAAAIHRKLHAADVHVMHHAGRLRVSIHGYNTAGDIRCFLGALHATLE
jgi:selenocysteine lyase/cysteine desulfurase